MNYNKVQIAIGGMPDYEVDTITYMLAEAGYECFETIEAFLCAYIKRTDFDDVRLKEVVGNYEYSVEEMPDVNWNEEWEKNYFQPIVVGDKCQIRSSFHKTEGHFDYEILIDPKMSFGTGHHQTTRCMMRWILADDFDGKSVLDMGCGTGVLGMLAAKRGASPVLGIDIDEWCVSNAGENVALNNVVMSVQLGEAASLAGMSFDVVLANINRNILLADMKCYIDTLSDGGRLYMSGFYTEDIAAIRECAENLGMTYVDHFEENNWVAVKFVK